MLEGFVPWPAMVAARYRRAGVWLGESLLVDLRRPALEDPSPLALVDESFTYTRGELWGAVATRARGLRVAGLDPGDRMVIQLPNSTDLVITFLACLWSGVIPVMALPGHRRAELVHMASVSGARAMCASSVSAPDADFLELADQVSEQVPTVQIIIEDGIRAGDVCLDDSGALDEPHQASGSDIALLLLSGGTTGLPKLIARTHDDYAYNIRQSSSVSGLTAESRYLVALPAGHNFPLGCPGLLGTLSHGGMVIMASSPSERGTFGLAREYRPTISAVVPAIAISWMESEARDALDSLEVLQVGGARMNPEIAKQVTPRLGCTLQQVFGMAEGLLNFTHVDDPDHVIVHTQGRKVSIFDEIRIVDENDQPVAHGAVGELLTRGPYTIRGYFAAPEHNARSFTIDGFYRTGDLVRIDEEGNIIVEGRSRDHINRGGEKISAEEIENFVLAHSHVVNAAAVGMPDDVLGERVCVFIEASGPVTLEELRAIFTERGVAVFKAPERLEIVDSLPLTNVGKVDKAALRGLSSAVKGI
jgi:2,3-dihydroxybenzoate-AMP ligase